MLQDMRLMTTPKYHSTGCCRSKVGRSVNPNVSSLQEAYVAQLLHDAVYKSSGAVPYFLCELSVVLLSFVYANERSVMLMLVLLASKSFPATNYPLCNRGPVILMMTTWHPRLWWSDPAGRLLSWQVLTRWDEMSLRTHRLHPDSDVCSRFSFARYPQASPRSNPPVVPNEANVGGDAEVAYSRYSSRAR